LIPISRTLDGDEWQELVIKLLYLHYGTDLVEVPDTHRGDGGIEAFALDGCAFQCYAPEGPATPAEIADKHKKKVSRDLKKFRDNRNKLIKIFGTTKIKRWVLLVPEHCSSDVVEFCHTKAEEVRKCQPPLPYITEDFVVLAANGYGVLAAEVAILSQVGAMLIEATIEPVASQQIDRFLQQYNHLVEVLDDKLKKIPALEEDARAVLRKKLLQMHLEGSNAVSYYDGKYPVIADRIRSVKQLRAKALEIESLLQKLTISTTRREFETELLTSVPALGRQTAVTISWASVAEWLMVCPLKPRA
jgi:hypothetical protein